MWVWIPPPLSISNKKARKIPETKGLLPRKFLEVKGACHRKFYSVKSPEKIPQTKGPLQLIFFVYEYNTARLMGYIIRSPIFSQGKWISEPSKPTCFSGKVSGLTSHNEHHFKKRIVNIIYERVLLRTTPPPLIHATAFYKILYIFYILVYWRLILFCFGKGY